MSNFLGEWQENTLHLARELTLTTLDGATLGKMQFPNAICNISAATLQAVDSVGVAALLWLAAQGKQQKIALNWQQIPDNLNYLLKLYEIKLQT